MPKRRPIKWIEDYKDRIISECNEGNFEIILEVAIERNIKPKSVLRALSDIGIYRADLGSSEILQQFEKYGVEDALHILKSRGVKGEQKYEPMTVEEVLPSTYEKFREYKNSNAFTNNNDALENLLEGKRLAVSEAAYDEFMKYKPPGMSSEQFLISLLEHRK